MTLKSIAFPRDIEVQYFTPRRWKVAMPFQYTIETDSGKLEFYVPMGFVTDFASVPQVFWSIFPPDGAWTQPAVVHDYLYSAGGKVKAIIADTRAVIDVAFTRADADRIFKLGMQCMKVDGIQLTLMWCAVRIFGKGNFKP